MLTRYGTSDIPFVPFVPAHITVISFLLFIKELDITSIFLVIFTSAPFLDLVNVLLPNCSI